MIKNTSIKYILIVILILFGGNLLLLTTLIEKHNSFTEHHTNALINNPIISDVTSLLWSDMTKSQQDEAFEIVKSYLAKHKELVKSRKNVGKRNRNNPSFEWSCIVAKVSEGWGMHHVCIDLLEKSDTCEFISFGIAWDYKFEVKLSKNFNCHGFAADPTISYETNICPNVTFHQMGAQMLNQNMEIKGNELKGKGREEWWLVSVPLLRKALGLDRVNILKMDCEGCEYGLARDIVRDDPSFFEHVDQFIVEIHLTKEWLNSTETLYYYGILLKKLNDAGLRLHDARTLGCAPEHNKKGCFSDLVCGNNPNMCHNYLFAKA